MQQQIQRIEDKVQQLLKAYSIALKEIERLHKENSKLSQQLQSQTEQANQLHQKVETLTLNTGNLESDSKKDLEKRIDTYLKDIDKCLSLLHS